MTTYLPPVRVTNLWSCALRRPSSRGPCRHGQPAKVAVLPAGKRAVGSLGHGVKKFVTTGEAEEKRGRAEGSGGMAAGPKCGKMYMYVSFPHQRGLTRSSFTLFPNGRSCPMVASGVAECSFCEPYFCLSLLKPPVQLYSATRLAGEGEGGC